MGLFKKREKVVPKQVEKEKRAEQQSEAVLTIYTSTAKLDHLVGSARQLFKDVIEDIEVTNEEAFTIRFFDMT